MPTSVGNKPRGLRPQPPAITNREKPKVSLRYLSAAMKPGGLRPQPRVENEQSETEGFSPLPLFLRF